MYWVYNIGKMTEATKNLYRSGEAAEMIGIGHSTLRQWVREGRIKPTVRMLGGRYLWSLDTINQIREQLGLPAIEIAGAAEP